MRYVLAYEISCLKDQPLTARIAILEELKEHEYTEKWAYDWQFCTDRQNCGTSVWKPAMN